MKAQCSKLFSGWLGHGKVLRVSLVSISIFVTPKAHAACALPQNVQEMVPEVQAIVHSKTRQGDLARCYLRYAHALKNLEIDQVVTPDARFHDLEAVGYPKGPEGLKAARRWLNVKLPDEGARITAMRFVGDDIIEVDIESIGSTDPKTGQRMSLTTHARDRFVGDRVAERWDRAVVQVDTPQLNTPTKQK